MKRLKFVLVLALSACASAPSAQQQTVRVLSYNIHAGKDAQQVYAIPRVAAFIDSLKPDIVMLQEVDRKTTRSGGEDHLAQLEKATGMHAAFGKSLDYQGGEYGIAILSRWPIDSAVVIPLKVVPPQADVGRQYEPRIALHVILRAPSGAIHVINTHIDSQGAPTYRKQEVVGILAAIQRTVPADRPLVFGGDLNTRPETDEIAAFSLYMTDTWAVCGSGPGYTFNNVAPDRRIDYVFYRNARCTSARVPETHASDHRPLFVTIEIQGKQ